MPAFSLVLPMYNEEAIIQNVVRELEETFEREHLDYQLVIVNNGSRDKTEDILKTLAKKNPRIKPVHITVNEGYGWGVTSGLNNADGDIIGFVDGDGQVPPADILRVYHGFDNQMQIFCKGIRYNRGDRWKRILASFSYNAIFKVLFLTTARDINGKPKLFKKDFYKTLHLESKDWFIDPEIIIKTLHKGYKPKEITVHFDERKKGKSNVKLQTIIEFSKNLMKWRLALWTKKKL